jgi:hypothetical protein
MSVRDRGYTVPLHRVYEFELTVISLDWMTDRPYSRSRVQQGGGGPEGSLSRLIVVLSLLANTIMRILQ